MLFASLGKRYERILLFTAPISLAAIAVMVVALASSKQQERVDAQCLTLAARTLTASQETLAKEWQRAQPASKKEYWGSHYKLAMETAWINADQTPECYQMIDKEIGENYRQAPEKVIAYLNGQAAELLQKPLSMYGVQLPPNTTVDLLGTKIQIELVSFARILQVVLLPVLLMWLGSLYTTRYRETIVIGQATTLAEVFPHIINMYLAGDFPTPRKRNRLAPYVMPFFCVLSAFVRISLLSLFVLPPVASYLASLYLLGSEALAPVFFAAGIVVSLFCFTVLFAELLPQHVLKHFPSAVSSPEGR